MGPSNKEHRSSWALQCYDPLEDHAVVWRRLPHWSQAGTVCFIKGLSGGSGSMIVDRKPHAEREEYGRAHPDLGLPVSCLADSGFWTGDGLVPSQREIRGLHR
jgi:hypothetical protein